MTSTPHHDPGSSGSSSLLSASYPKSAGSLLTSLFRTRSSDSETNASDGSNGRLATAPAPKRNGQSIPAGNSDGEAKRETSSGTNWLLNRKPSDKKKDKPERLRSSLFTSSGFTKQVNSKSDVKGAVKDEWPMYSGKPEDYEISETIGFGATSVVRLATYKPLNQVVAVKIMDFEGRSSIRMMQREVELMSLSKHPNILRVRGDWVDGSRLCIATRFIPHGSLLDIMEYGFQDGLDEITCATILKQACEGIHYLHINGWLHRDVKAGNLLIDEDGTVLISDFGCSSQVLGIAPEGTSPTSEQALQESLTLRTRKSFVGTPCWMAPEVVEQRPYDSKADIWSFGITAIEIATGRAPHSLYTPAQILMKTVAEKPPTLDLDGHAHPFSKLFKDMIDTCLKKDAAKRPTAEKLLAHPFFKGAKRKSHLVGSLLAGLPPVQARQTRRSRRSISGLSATRGLNASVWDFDASPVTESFRNFTMNYASPGTSVSPPHSRRSSNSHIDSVEPPLVTPSSARSARRRNNSSILSPHRQTISFEAVPELDHPEHSETSFNSSDTSSGPQKTS